MFLDHASTCIPHKNPPQTPIMHDSYSLLLLLLFFKSHPIFTTTSNYSLLFTIIIYIFRLFLGDDLQETSPKISLLFCLFFYLPLPPPNICRARHFMGNQGKGWKLKVKNRWGGVGCKGGDRGEQSEREWVREGEQERPLAFVISLNWFNCPH